DTTPSRSLPTGDAMKRYGFSRYTGKRIQLAGVHCRVSVGNPAHLPFACSVVRRRHVDRRTDKIFLDQLYSIPPGDIFQLANRIVFWIDGYTALGTAKRHINDGTFVGHQCGKSHHLVFIDHIAVTDTTLGWRHVL